MKIKNILLSLLLICAVRLCATSVSVPENLLAEGLTRLLEQYQRLEPHKPVESWAQLERVNPGFYGINSVLKQGSVTELFSFIPLNQRDFFPLGELILVQSKAMPWPDHWRMKDPRNPDKYIEQSGYQDIRFLIYAKNGVFVAEQWYEAKFQAMLTETGLTVPSPTPYYPPAPTRPDEKLINTSKPTAPVVASKTAPAIAPVAPAAPIPPSPSRSLNPLLWWIMGVMAALVAGMLIVRRKKPKV